MVTRILPEMPPKTPWMLDGDQAFLCPSIPQHTLLLLFIYTRGLIIGALPCVAARKSSLLTSSMILSLVGPPFLSLLTPIWHTVFSRVSFICSISISIVFPTPVALLASANINHKFEPLTKFRELINVGLHTNPIISMLPEERKPDLHRLWISILYLDQPPHSPPLKVLLRFLVNEVAPRNSPSLNDSW